MITEQIFLGSAQKRLMQQGTPVLMYHYFGPPDSKTHDPYLYVSAKNLNREITALKNLGYTSANLTELADACDSGIALDHRVVITVDDGAENFFQGAMDILDAHDYKAIQFIVADRIGGFNEWDIKHGHPAIRLMNDDQIREWLQHGHEIGSHTLTHPNLLNLSEKEARNEITTSKKLLEDRYQTPIRHFCYPHGKFNPMLVDLVTQAGYETACSTRFGVNGHRQDLKAFNRISTLSAPALAGKIFHRLKRKLKLS